MSTVPRPLHIASLFPELLLRIFTLARGGTADSDSDPFAQEWQDVPLDLDAIRNIRLTCRLFNDIASELLLRRLDVFLNTKSLHHVKEVVRNPSIARGISAIRLNLDCYFVTFTSRPRFIELISHTLLRQQEAVLRPYMDYLDHLESGADRDWDQEALFERNGLPFTPPLHDVAVITMLGNVTRIIMTYQFMLFRPQMMVDYSHGARQDSIAITKHGHRRYTHLFQQQHKVFQNHLLLRVLHDAIPKMPRVRRLVITDDQKYMGERIQPWPAMANDSHFLVEREFLRPRRWDEWLVPDAIRQQGAPFPTFLLHVLPRLFSHRGCSLAHLDIRLSAAGEMNWLLTKQLIPQFRKPAASLKTFRCLVDADARLQILMFSIFLHAFAGGKRLRTYHVALTRAPSPPHYVAVGPLLAPFSSSSLVTVWISGCMFHLQDIQAFAVALRTRLRIKLQSLTLRNTRMLSGTLEEAGDLLRGSAIRLVIDGPPGG